MTLCTDGKNGPRGGKHSSFSEEEPHWTVRGFQGRGGFTHFTLHVYPYREADGWPCTSGEWVDFRRCRPLTPRAIKGVLESITNKGLEKGGEGGVGMAGGAGQVDEKAYTAEDMTEGGAVGMTRGAGQVDEKAYTTEDVTEGR